MNKHKKCARCSNTKASRRCWICWVTAVCASAILQRAPRTTRRTIVKSIIIFISFGFHLFPHFFWFVTKPRSVYDYIASILYGTPPNASLVRMVEYRQRIYYGSRVCVCASPGSAYASLTKCIVICDEDKNRYFFIYYYFSLLHIFTTERSRIYFSFPVQNSNTSLSRSSFPICVCFLFFRSLFWCCVWREVVSGSATFF